MYWSSPFFLIPNDLLVVFYQKAVKQKHDKEVIELLFAEIKFRNLRIDKSVPLSESTLQILDLYLNFVLANHPSFEGAQNIDL